MKRSRFLCRVEPVTGEAAARAEVERARREHWDARHHCSAFILGPARSVERSSDDGEPSGTAGAPMLEVLRGSGYTDVVAVVTRWFGGTLLGAGGLVRAYSEAVQAALEHVVPRRRELRELWRCRVAHAEAGRLESELRRHGHVVVEQAYGSAVDLTLGVRDTPAFLALVAQQTEGKVLPERVGQEWVDG